jgi:cyclic-di-GMP phosphodiesterase TipF (flagellum assembly factor)
VFDPWALERGNATSLEMPAMPSLKKAGAPAPGEISDPFSFRPTQLPGFGNAEAAAAPASGGLSALQPLAIETSGAAPSGPPPLPPSLPQVDAGQSDTAAQVAEVVAKVAANAPPEMSVEMIQDLIKKLADELNTTPQTPPKVRGKLVPQQPDPEAMVQRSISALEAAAKTMRGNANPQSAQQAPAAPQTAQQRQAPPPPPPPAAAKAARGGAQAQGQQAQQAQQQAVTAPAESAINPQLMRVAEALASERIEVMLEPIQSLSEGRTKHFEITTRLLAADGAVLTHEDVVRIAQGSGLMPRIDIARIVRAARVARRLGEGGRAGSVLTPAAGESLTDHRFLSTASSEQNPNATMRLVISFQQSEVRMFSPGHMQTLSALSAAGFRFALDGVTDLDMDFSDLKRLGFDFVKLDAPVFMEGLPAPGGVVPAADITRMLTDNGLTLVVGRIEDDWQLARVLGAGALYGRGTLFGGPRMVKPEVVAAPNAVA